MKVALFTDTFLPQINGVTKTLDKLTDYFNKNGVDYLVFAPDNPKDNNGFENNVQRMLSFSFFLYPECRISIPNYFKIKTELNDYKPDLIHIVTPFNLGLCGLKYANSHDIPLVASYHTNFNQYLNYYNLNFLEGPIWRFFRWFHSHCQCNFCPSKSTLEELRKNGINNLEIWGRGINAKDYSPDFKDNTLREEYGLEDKIILLYVGRLAPEKNLKLLIDSLKMVNHKYIDKVELVITGSGPLEEELKEIAPSNVTFTGYLTGQDLARTYASADVFTFPSLTETYGNVVLEAMASGLPVVGILSGGVKENLLDGYNGLAISSNNLSEFSSNLEEIIINERLRKKLARNARQYALNQSWNSIFSRLVRNYREVINYKESKKIISA